MPDTTVAPYKSIVRITVQIGTSLYQGSGVMISPDEVLTASHMVWTTGVGTATNIKVMPGYSNGVAPFGTYSGTVAHYNAINDSGGVLSLPDIANDYAIIHLSTPTTVGTMSLGSDFSGGAVTVSGYPSTSAAQVDQAETLTTGQFNELTGPALGAGSSGGPAWTTDVGGGAGTVVGLVSAESLTGTGYFPKITAAIRTQLLTWVAADDGVNTVASYVDTKTQQSGTVAMTATTTGPSYLQWQYIWSSADNVSIATGVPNSFLHGGAGDDALAVSSGQNVLDGGAGSNFLVGGSGTDTFYTDSRGTAVVWNTMENFHTGDYATLWGFTPGVSSYTWDPTPAGAVGATGATLRANIIGGAGRTGNGIDASITFTGMSVAQAKSMITTVSTAGSAAPYLLIYNQGV